MDALGTIGWLTVLVLLAGIAAWLWRARHPVLGGPRFERDRREAFEDLRRLLQSVAAQLAEAEIPEYKYRALAGEVDAFLLAHGRYLGELETRLVHDYLDALRASNLYLGARIDALEMKHVPETVALPTDLRGQLHQMGKARDEARCLQEQLNELFDRVLAPPSAGPSGRTPDS